jgi:hypothetical protein
MQPFVTAISVPWFLLLLLHRYNYVVAFLPAGNINNHARQNYRTLNAHGNGREACDNDDISSLNDITAFTQRSTLLLHNAARIVGVS